MAVILVMLTYYTFVDVVVGLISTLSSSS